MASSTEKPPAQQAPAGQKPGLKVRKPAAAAPEPATGSRAVVGHPSSNTSTTTTTSSSKRKLDAPPHTSKRLRKDEPTDSRTGSLKKQKSVTFTDNPSVTTFDVADAPTASNLSSADTTAKSKPQSKSKSKTNPQHEAETDTKAQGKSPAKKKKQAPPSTDLTPALEYLRLWKTARDAWKFNKNHQSLLIKHIFDVDGIPASEINAFFDYIQDLKGMVRMRLRDSALEIRTKDRTEGPALFPDGTSDLEATQQRYETILAKFLDSQPVGSKRKCFDEPEYVTSSDDGDAIIQRLVKRMRAELVLDEISDGGNTADTENSNSSAPSSHTSSRTLTTSEGRATTNVQGDKRLKLNDGTVKRRRKLRTAASDSDDTSSSDSSSDSDSDSDSDDSDTSSEGDSDDDDEDTSSSGSSSSSSDESSDDDEADDPRGNDADTSSSSESSSSEDSDSDDE